MATIRQRTGAGAPLELTFERGDVEASKQLETALSEISTKKLGGNKTPAERKRLYDTVLKHVDANEIYHLGQSLAANPKLKGLGHSLLGYAVSQRRRELEQHPDIGLAKTKAVVDELRAIGEHTYKNYAESLRSGMRIVVNTDWPKTPEPKFFEKKAYSDEPQQLNSASPFMGHPQLKAMANEAQRQRGKEFTMDVAGVEFHAQIRKTEVTGTVKGFFGREKKKVTQQDRLFVWAVDSKGKQHYLSGEMSGNAEFHELTRNENQAKPPAEQVPKPQAARQRAPQTVAPPKPQTKPSPPVGGQRTSSRVYQEAESTATTQRFPHINPYAVSVEESLKFTAKAIGSSDKFVEAFPAVLKDRLEKIKAGTIDAGILCHRTYAEAGESTLNRVLGYLVSTNNGGGYASEAGVMYNSDHRGLAALVHNPSTSNAVGLRHNVEERVAGGKPTLTYNYDSQYHSVDSAGRPGPKLAVNVETDAELTKALRDNPHMVPLFFTAASLYCTKTDKKIVADVAMTMAAQAKREGKDLPKAPQMLQYDTVTFFKMQSEKMDYDSYDVRKDYPSSKKKDDTTLLDILFKDKPIEQKFAGGVRPPQQFRLTKKFEKDPSDALTSLRYHAKSRRVQLMEESKS